jgi:hypothetical protein
MKLLTRRALRAAAPAVAALAVLLVIGPARAVAPEFHLDLQSDPVYPGWGTGRVTGDLEFTGKFKFDYDLLVADLCPGDNVGTSFYFISDLGDGEQVTSKVRGYDTNGCGNGWEPWASALQTQRIIARTRVAQCVTNDGDLCWLVSTKLGGWKDNPTW